MFTVGAVIQGGMLTIEALLQGGGGPKWGFMFTIGPLYSKYYHTLHINFSSCFNFFQIYKTEGFKKNVEILGESDIEPP